MAEYTNKQIGQLGEDAAINFLKKNKYKIIERNFRCKSGEVDIICQNKDYIVFVEVKTRKVDSLVGGVFAVNYQKQQHIIKTAFAYINDHKVKKQPRFDIIEVEFDSKSGNALVAQHYTDAFSQGGEYAVF